MAENESLIRKIEALLAKANNAACTPEEAAAFNAKAHELITKYNIDRATIGAAKAVERGHMTLTVLYRPWAEATLLGITKLYFCKYFITQTGKQHTITIVGERQNLAMCHAIAVMTLRSIIQASRKANGGRSFMTGAGQEVYRRCLEMIAHTEKPLEGPKAQLQITSGQGQALVTLAKSEAQGNAEYIAVTLGKNLRSRRGHGAKVNNTGSYMQGVQHGSTVQLRRNLLGSS